MSSSSNFSTSGVLTDDVMKSCKLSLSAFELLCARRIASVICVARQSVTSLPSPSLPPDGDTSIRTAGCTGYSSCTTRLVAAATTLHRRRSCWGNFPAQLLKLTAQVLQDNLPLGFARCFWPQHWICRSFEVRENKQQKANNTNHCHSNQTNGHNAIIGNDPGALWNWPLVVGEVCGTSHYPLPASACFPGLSSEHPAGRGCSWDCGTGCRPWRCCPPGTWRGRPRRLRDCSRYSPHQHLQRVGETFAWAGVNRFQTCCGFRLPLFPFFRVCICSKKLQSYVSFKHTVQKLPQITVTLTVHVRVRLYWTKKIPFAFAFTHCQWTLKRLRKTCNLRSLLFTWPCEGNKTRGQILYTIKNPFQRRLCNLTASPRWFLNYILRWFVV